jgi:hypothetical protein
VLDADVDWDEVADLLTESYCVMAPKRLAAMLAKRDVRTRGGQPRRQPGRDW